MERARGGHWLPQEWQARRENLRRGRMSLTQQIERLTEAYLSGVVPLAEFERRHRETEGRLGALERQEQELLADARDRHETARLADHAEEFCRRIRDGLASADFERKRALLELLVDRVVVTDGEVEIRYAFPTGPDGEREPFCRLRTDYLQGLVRSVLLRSVLPLQAVADHVHDPADHPPVVYSGHAVRQRQVRRNPRHLALTEQK
jgi:site-specific DNA recombinase